jgi:hypothetical protein
MWWRFYFSINAIGIEPLLTYYGGYLLGTFFIAGCCQPRYFSIILTYLFNKPRAILLQKTA